MTFVEFDRWLKSGAAERATLVMGVLNVTPDSFSDGGKFSNPAAAAEQARRMAEAGADLIDIGGESTRPGSEQVSAAEQIKRVMPVIEAIIRAGGPPAVLSIDTTLAAVAEAALDGGARVVNDISGGRDDAQMLPLVGQRGAAVVLMHMQNDPATMQIAPHYDDVAVEVKDFLRQRAEAAVSAGVADHRILVDPGIGFGKTLEHNLALLRGIGSICELPWPVVIGTSRKGFIGKITGETEPRERLFGTAASVAWSVANGCAIARVHDVEPMVKVVRMIRAIRGNSLARATGGLV